MDRVCEDGHGDRQKGRTEMKLILRQREREKSAWLLRAESCAGGGDHAHADMLMGPWGGDKRR